MGFMMDWGERPAFHFGSLGSHSFFWTGFWCGSRVQLHTHRVTSACHTEKVTQAAAQQVHMNTVLQATYDFLHNTPIPLDRDEEGPVLVCPVVHSSDSGHGGIVLSPFTLCCQFCVLRDTSPIFEWHN